LKLGAVLANLEKPNRKEIFPYNFLLFIENQRTAFLAQFVKMFQPGLKPESLQYLHDYASGDAGKEGSLEYKITDKFHFVLKEHNSLKKRVKQLAKTIKEKKENPIKDQNFEKEIEDLEMEKSSLNAIIAKISDKETFNFFTDEGLLPNYSFPEAGVTLRSIILKKKTKADEHGKYKTTIYEYERPAATAISELAPANRFYAEGRMVTVDQIDMALSTVEEWQFCNECSHHELVLTGGDTQCCPQCHSPLWKDEAQKRQMVRLRQVVATTYDRDSRIEDDSDVREPEFYNKQLLVDFDPKFITSAYQLDKPDFPFGFEFLRKVAFREINFGQKQANVEEINIAGKPMPKIGFVLCRECGKVHNVREKFEHAISCRYRNSKTEKTIQDCLYLYREFSSEAIRILLPVLSLTEDQKLHSFIAALYLGLKKKFGGNIDHLRTAIHEEPIPESGLRKKYLVLYDVVPGGTGYLKELMRPPQPLMEVFQLAREVLRSCECGQAPDKDGCYRCLYIYRQSHDRANISRKVALDFLGKLLDGETAFQKTDTISNISINCLLESELEARFIEALRRAKHQEQPFQFKPDVVNGKPGWRLKAGEQMWLIEPQVELGPKDNVAFPVRADFIFHPERSAQALPVAVFTDGFMFHAEGENHRVGHDMAQRMALQGSGRFNIWSLTWDVPCSAGQARRWLRRSNARRPLQTHAASPAAKMGTPHSCNGKSASERKPKLTDMVALKSSWRRWNWRTSPQRRSWKIRSTSSASPWPSASVSTDARPCRFSSSKNTTLLAATRLATVSLSTSKGAASVDFSKPASSKTSILPTSMVSATTSANGSGTVTFGSSAPITNSSPQRNGSK
jgi:DEAD/DEAH box helicase domain-containing protein